MNGYMGIFFEGEQAEIIKNMQPTKLEKINDELHCTFKYKPTDEEVKKFDELIGQEIDVYLVSYGCNGKNSGFEVVFDEYYDSYYINFDNKLDENGNPILKPKHITVSLAKNARANDTKDLDFVKLAEPILVTGRFGYWLNGKEVTNNPYYERIFDNKNKTL